VKASERHRWETAIRCLEVALHPRTGDDEVLAAVNGFRRTANGVPLSDVCLAFATPGALPAIARWSDAATAAETRAQQAEARVDELDAQLAAARHRAEAAERALADMGTAYARQLDGLSRERAELRAMLDRVTLDRATLDRAARPAPPSFQQVLSATMGLEPPRPAAPSASRYPWTA
jgi:hypothetical protein